MSQAELVLELRQQRELILNWLDSLSPMQRAQSLTAGGWRVQDFLGHFTFWEQQTLTHIRDTLKIGRPTALPPQTVDEDLNGRAAAQRAAWTWERVRAEFVNTRTALIQRVLELDARTLEFYVPSPWLGDSRIVSLETLVREDVLQHTAEHVSELRAKLGGMLSENG